MKDISAVNKNERYVVKEISEQERKSTPSMGIGNLASCQPESSKTTLQINSSKDRIEE